MNRTRWGAAILGVMALAGSLVFGQGFSAAISGSVRDASGAVIPQATVTVRNVETGQTRTTETGANGNYNVPALPVGPYEVTVEKPGFRQLVRSGITLTVGQEAALNLTLEVGNVTQTVEVTGEAPLVNTTLASTAGLITGEQIKDLPLNGRSFHQLMTLNPHTVDNRSNSGGASFSVAGKRTENNRWTMNGMDYVGDNATGQFIAPTGISGQLLGVEAVREFNVLGHTYGAEYGKRSGGQVTAVTTSGTNTLHGTAFEYLRNSAFDARNFFDTEDLNGDGQADAAPFKRNQFGGSLGGPIVRDKMFVFGNYEGFRERRGESSFRFVPSAEVRRGLLPCNQIYTGSARTANCGTSLSGLNAYVPVPNLQRGMLPYAEHFWPLPNGPEQADANGLLTGIASVASNPVRGREEDFGLARFDYNISSADSLSANFTVDEGRELDPENNTLF
ncbi:MAG: carboxypeptidase-like regulatory domain-containing protein, partial [Terriglobia bacterium]